MGLKFCLSNLLLPKSHHTLLNRSLQTSWGIMHLKQSEYYGGNQHRFTLEFCSTMMENMLPYESHKLSQPLSSDQTINSHTHFYESSMWTVNLDQSWSYYALVDPF